MRSFFSQALFLGHDPISTHTQQKGQEWAEVRIVEDDLSLANSLKIFELLLMETLPGIHQHILDLGLPLDSYFTDHFIQSFAGFFHTEMVFRL